MTRFDQNPQGAKGTHSLTFFSLTAFLLYDFCIPLIHLLCSPLWKQQLCTSPACLIFRSLHYPIDWQEGFSTPSGSNFSFIDLAILREASCGAGKENEKL
jgi:hypothetical protein